jgi:cytochrome c oxidase subunit 2
MLGTVVAGLWSTNAAADQPVPWQIGLQDAVSPVMENITGFWDLLFWLCVVIASFVLILMVICMVRFNAKANPVPSKTTHNTLIEVAWTVVPILILVVIAIPSFRYLYYADKAVDAEMTIKALGYQWYWGYEYPDHGGLAFDATMKEAEDLGEGELRLLTTDEVLYVPVDTKIRLLVTGMDVIHAWAIPAFGIKLDGVPGRVNEAWFQVDKPGTYYGQCSELCGSRHGFMPIMVKAVSKKEFADWVEQAKKKYASAKAERLSVAQAAAPAPAN